MNVALPGLFSYLFFFIIRINLNIHNKRFYYFNTLLQGDTFDLLIGQERVGSIELQKEE